MGCGAVKWICLAVVITVMNVQRVMKVCVRVCAHTRLSVPQQCMQCMLGAHSIIIVGLSLSFAKLFLENSFDRKTAPCVLHWQLF